MPYAWQTADREKQAFKVEDQAHPFDRRPNRFTTIKLRAMNSNALGAACRSLPAFLWLVCLCGCSPVFNWRDITVTNDLRALLPCKPERATRNLEIPGIERMSVSMTGCPAGDATFALAQAEATSAAQAVTWVTAWKASTRAQWPDARQTEVVATIAGADPASSSRLSIVHDADTAAGTQVAEQPLRAEMLWFTRTVDATHVTVYQAMVLGKPSADDAVATFFEGLRLPGRRSPA